MQIAWHSNTHGRNLSCRSGHRNHLLFFIINLDTHSNYSCWECKFDLYQLWITHVHAVLCFCSLSPAYRMTLNTHMVLWTNRGLHTGSKPTKYKNVCFKIWVKRWANLLMIRRIYFTMVTSPEFTSYQLNYHIQLNIESCSNHKKT